MSVFANNIVGVYTDSNEYFIVMYVVTVVFLGVLYQLYNRLKQKSSPLDFNDSNTYVMDNYTLNFEHSDVAMAGSEKKISVITKIVVWSLATFFVVTPFYGVILTLQSGYSEVNVFANCLEALQ